MSSQFCLVLSSLAFFVDDLTDTHLMKDKRVFFAFESLRVDEVVPMHDSTFPSDVRYRNDSRHESREYCPVVCERAVCDIPSAEVVGYACGTNWLSGCSREYFYDAADKKGRAMVSLVVWRCDVYMVFFLTRRQ